MKVRCCIYICRVWGLHVPVTPMCCWPSLQNPTSLQSWSLAFAHWVNTRSSLMALQPLSFFFLTFVQPRRGMWTRGISFHRSGRLLLPALLAELRSVQNTQLTFPSLRKTRCDTCPRDPLQKSTGPLVWETWPQSGSFLSTLLALCSGGVEGDLYVSNFRWATATRRHLCEQKHVG